MNNRKLKIFLAASLLMNLVIVACGAKKVPRFDQPIYTFDEKACLFRYKFDVDVIPCNDPRAKGMMALTQKAQDRFFDTYLAGCMQWDPSLELIDFKP